MQACPSEIRFLFSYCPSSTGSKTMSIDGLLVLLSVRVCVRAITYLTNRSYGNYYGSDVTGRSRYAGWSSGNSSRSTISMAASFADTGSSLWMRHTV